MTIDIKEKQFENDIESSLLKNDYVKRKSENLDKKLIIDPELFFEFLQKSQKEKSLQIEEMYGSGAKDEILRALEKKLEDKSMIHVLRQGFEVSGVHLDCVFFKPVSGLDPESQKQFEQNILSVIRQAHYKQDSEKSLDLVLFLNGLPVATAELKNPATGQNFEDAIKQYKEDRDPKDLLFRFKKRALVHFAVDPYQVHMTTKLEGSKTRFLPFDRGRDGGKGNPDNPNGYRTSYLWEDIWTKENWLEILANFIHLQIIKQKLPAPPKENIIFPRYHQLDAVLKLTSAAKKNGPGTNYLIQHSTGSGKSNTIGWLCYKLFSLFNEQDKPIYDGIIVISDRIAIVDQLGKTIKQFEQTPGTVESVESSSELADNLETHRKILISTQQKFPFVLEKLNQIKGRNFAIIVDEAHSSQSGESAQKVKEVLTKNLEDTLEKEAEQEAQEEESRKDLVDRIEEEMEKRGKRDNLSYFAFTATPKKKTLRLFGTQVSSEDYIPFHIYSMNQAIEENFILDVLKHYSTYEGYFKIVKTAAEDKIVEAKKASRALMRYVDTHHLNIATKAQVIVEHFKTHTQPKIGRVAKAMVVGSSRFQAYRYKQEIDEYIQKQGYQGIRTLVAFSGSLHVDGEIVTEQKINNTKTNQELVDKFDTPDYNILIVAEKYQTGYDQPLLHTMYVDKKLKGIKAVQTLSRLNRTHPGKIDTFVVDFQNKADEIKYAYMPYYKGTTLIDKTTPGYLFNLYDQIISREIITENDLDKFAEIFFKDRQSQTDSDLGKLYASMDPVIDRYNDTKEPQQDEFRTKLVKYIEAYSFLTQVVPYDDTKLEKLFVVCRFLAHEKVLQIIGSQIPELRGDISLQWYRLEKTHEGDISIGKKIRPLVAGDEYGTTKPPEIPTSLSELIRLLNERFGGPFSDADIVTIEEWENLLKNMPELRVMAQENEFSDFLRHFEAKFQEIMLSSMDQNQNLVSRVFSNPEFRREITIKAAEQYHKWARMPELPPITPGNTWQNRHLFRQTIHRCKGFVHWIDLYLNKDALDFLMDSFDKQKVKEIKILTGLHDNEYSINEKLLERFKSYQEELAKNGISLEFKIIATKQGRDRVAHDRYLLGENRKFNVVSFTMLKKGRLSEIIETTNEIPFEDYWNDKDSVDIIKDWDVIKSSLVNEYTCADCGEKFSLSFKLPQGKPAYCPKCFPKHRRS